MLLNEAGMSGFRFAVFRPAWLTTAPVKKFYRYFLGITALDYGALPLRNAKMITGRGHIKTGTGSVVWARSSLSGYEIEGYITLASVSM